jgi:hypothetical protein
VKIESHWMFLLLPLWIVAPFVGLAVAWKTVGGSPTMQETTQYFVSWGAVAVGWFLFGTFLALAGCSRLTRQDLLAAAAWSVFIGFYWGQFILTARSRPPPSAVGQPVEFVVGFAKNYAVFVHPTSGPASGAQFEFYLPRKEFDAALARGGGRLMGKVYKGGRNNLWFAKLD